MAHRDAKTASKFVSRGLVTLTAAALIATTMLPVSQAHADHRRHFKGHHDRVVIIEKHRHHKPKRKHRSNRDGDLLAAGILGLAVGAIIANEASRQRQPDVVYVQPQPRYIEPAPIYREPIHRRSLDRVYSQPLPSRYPDRVYDRDYDTGYDRGFEDGPRVITYEDSVNYSYEPWSPGWAEWCRNRYRSFNATTGTFRGYDGQDHFCVVK